MLLKNILINVQLIRQLLDVDFLLKVQFSSQLIIFTVVVCLTPTFAGCLTKEQNRAVSVLVESVLFIVLILGFGLWLFGKSILGNWIIYTVVLVLLLEIGSNIVEHLKIITLNRLANEITFKQVKNQVEAFESMFLIEQSIYSPIPLSLVIGTIAIWFSNQTPKEIILFSFKLFLFLFSLSIMCFLCMGFVRISDTLFHENYVSSPKLKKERKGFLGWVKLVIIRVTQQLPFKKDPEKEAIELACTVSDLRKIYLYDAIHNSTLLIASVTVLLWLLGGILNLILLVSSLVGIILFLNLLPYSIGQAALHNKILERYKGMKRIKLLEKLRKYSPLFPFFSLQSTSSSNSFVNLRHFLFDRDWNNRLKDIINIMEQNERQRNTKLLRTIETMAEQPKYDQRGAKINIGSYVDTAQPGSRQEGHANQHNYAPEQKQSLAEAAEEIQKLLEQLEKEKSYPTETLSQQAIVAEETIRQIEANKDWKQKVINAVKAMGIEAFMEMIDNPVANVLRAGIEGWMEEDSD